MLIVQITANGQTIDVELTAEQAKKLGLTEKKRTGWERAKEHDAYYGLDGYLDIVVNEENSDNIDDVMFRRGNYFADKALAEKMAKRVGLMLRMQRWADEHNGTIDWNDIDSIKFQICYDYRNKRLFVTSYRANRCFAQIYFSTQKLAEQAIEIFGDEIIKAYIKE